MVDPASSVNLDALGPSVDLSSLDSSRLFDIEKIDLTGTNRNTLVLDAQRLQQGRHQRRFLCRQRCW
jgi:hypothetical protein